MNGDKDTYRFAWMAVKQPYSFVEQAIGTAGMIDSNKQLCGTTMVQFDLSGRELFLHHNMLKSGPLKKAGSNWAQAHIPVMGKMHKFKPVPGDALELADETSINCMDIEGKYDVKLRPFREFEEKYFDADEDLSDAWLLTNMTERFKVEVPESILSSISGVNLNAAVRYESSFPTGEHAANASRLKIELTVSQESKDDRREKEDFPCSSKVWVDQVLLPLGHCSDFATVDAGKTIHMHNRFFHKLVAEDRGADKCKSVFTLVAQPFTGVITKKSVRVRLCGRIEGIKSVRCINTSVKMNMPRCRGKPKQKQVVS